MSAPFTRETAKGQLVALSFHQNQVAASQTNADLPTVETDDGTSVSLSAVDAYEAPWPFDIVGIQATLSAAATAGTLTVNPTIAGTVNASLQLDFTTEVALTDTAALDVASGVAGDAIGAQIDTNGDWDATTADLVVTVFVMFYLDHI